MASQMPPGWVPNGFSEDTLASTATSMGMDKEALRSMLWQQAQQAQTASTTITPMVKMGSSTQVKATPVLSPSGGLIPQSGTTTVPGDKLTQDQANASFYAWTPQQLAENMKKMRQAGFTVSSPTEAYTIWTHMVDGAAQSNLAKQSGVEGAKNMTPWQVLDFMAAGQGPDDGDTNNDGIADQGNDSKTTTNSNVVKYSPSDIRSTAEQTYATALGRAPTRGERRALRATINQMSAQNPVVQTTTTDYHNNIAGDSHSVTDGGVNEPQKVLNAARHQEGYGEYQAINYFDTMMSMLGAPGGV